MARKKGSSPDSVSEFAGIGCSLEPQLLESSLSSLDVDDIARQSNVMMRRYECLQNNEGESDDMRAAEM